jgi:membrane-associated phospholipid phosphatase
LPTRRVDQLERNFDTMHLDRSRIPTLVAAVLLLGSQPTAAQSVFHVMGQDIKNSVGDAWDVWTSPLRGTSRDWLTAAGAVGASAAVTPWDDDVDRWAVKQQNDAFWSWLKEFREGGAAFSGQQITPVALGLYAVGLLAHSPPLREGLVGCATAYGATSVVRTFVVYPLVARTRPDSGHSVHLPPAKSGDQYDFSVPGTTNWGRHSFPGGHITNVAACAAFLTERYDMGIAAPLPWLVVGAVAIGRTLDRRHWVSDQMIGGLFGYAVGKEIALRSFRRSKRKPAASPSHGSLSIVPAPGGVALRWSLDY